MRVRIPSILKYDAVSVKTISELYVRHHGIALEGYFRTVEIFVFDQYRVPIKFYMKIKP